MKMSSTFTEKRVLGVILIILLLFGVVGTAKESFQAYNSFQTFKSVLSIHENNIYLSGSSGRFEFTKLDTYNRLITKAELNCLLSSELSIGKLKGRASDNQNFALLIDNRELHFEFHIKNDKLHFFPYQKIDNQQYSLLFTAVSNCEKNEFDGLFSLKAT